MQKCWNCRRRRLKCDGSLPHCDKCKKVGAECLGYGKLFTWIGGVASRGHMRNSTFPLPPPKTDAGTSQGLKYVTYVSQPDGGLHAAPGRCSASMILTPPAPAPKLMIPRALTEPVFQDLDSDTRGLISYYDRYICSGIMMVDDLHNPYRELISLVGRSTAVLNAMMAVAACHATHRRAGYPVFLHLGDQVVDSSTAQMISRSIVLKQRALRGLSDALVDFREGTRIHILATIVLLMLIELYEGGGGPWTVHLEGAKRLFDTEMGKSNTDSPRMIESILEELVIFDVLGGTFVQDGQPLTTRLAKSSRDELSSLCGLGCPKQILLAIESIAHQWRNWTNNKTGTAQVPSPAQLLALNAALEQITGFDIETWTDSALDSCSRSFTLSREDVRRICRVWRLSAEIYAAQVMRQLTLLANSPSTLVNQLISELKYLESDQRLIKFLLWPIFIAGAECTTLEHRAWTLTTLDRVWSISLIANVKAAAIVLTDLWQKQDAVEQVYCVQGLELRDWMVELSSLGTSWLFL